jgi:hypothetical protein
MKTQFDPILNSLNRLSYERELMVLAARDKAGNRSMEALQLSGDALR